MKYSESLRKREDFSLVYQERKSFANKYLVMYVRKNELGKNRLGISVSKKVGNSVVRHRIKRYIKESYRLQEEHFKCGVDIVVIAKVRSKNVKYHEIEKALLHLGNLHKITVKMPGPV